MHYETALISFFLVRIDDLSHIAREKVLGIVRPDYQGISLRPGFHAPALSVAPEHRDVISDTGWPTRCHRYNYTACSQHLLRSVLDNNLDDCRQGVRGKIRHAGDDEPVFELYTPELNFGLTQASSRGILIDEYCYYSWNTLIVWEYPNRERRNVSLCSGQKPG